MEAKHVNGTFQVQAFACVQSRVETSRGLENALALLPLCFEAPTKLDVSTMGFFSVVGLAYATWRDGVVTDLRYGPKPREESHAE